MESHALLACAAQLQECCIEQSITLSVAESLTGGLIGSTLASIPGASRYFKGGVIAYDASIKREVLRVPHEVIADYGVVSCQCAEAMAHGVQQLCSTHAAIAVTGEAGPQSSSFDIAVGTVWVACRRGDVVQSRLLRIEGERTHIRRSAVLEAISSLYSMMLPVS